MCVCVCVCVCKSVLQLCWRLPAEWRNECSSWRQLPSRAAQAGVVVHGGGGRSQNLSQLAGGRSGDTYLACVWFYLSPRYIQSGSDVIPYRACVTCLQVSLLRLSVRFSLLHNQRYEFIAVAWLCLPICKLTLTLTLTLTGWWSEQSSVRWIFLVHQKIIFWSIKSLITRLQGNNTCMHIAQWSSCIYSSDGSIEVTMQVRPQDSVIYYQHSWQEGCNGIVPHPHTHTHTHTRTHTQYMHMQEHPRQKTLARFTLLWSSLPSRKLQEEPLDSSSTCSQLRKPVLKTLQVGPIVRSLSIKSVLGPT